VLAVVIVIMIALSNGCLPPPGPSDGTENKPFPLELGKALTINCGQYARYSIDGSGDVFVSMKAPDKCSATLTARLRAGGEPQIELVKKASAKVIQIPPKKFSVIDLYCGPGNTGQCEFLVNRRTKPAGQGSFMGVSGKSPIQIKCGKSMEVYKSLSKRLTEIKVVFTQTCSPPNKSQRVTVKPMGNLHPKNPPKNTIFTGLLRTPGRSVIAHCTGRGNTCQVRVSIR